MPNKLNLLIRALRLPFASASILPFIFGSLLGRADFKGLNFFLGLVCALATHLGANLINDYADAKSGADWQDKKFYVFFGGSKLIQEGVFSVIFYRNLAIFFFALAGSSVFILSKILASRAILAYFFLILLLGWSYSSRPLQLAYRRLGEAVIFVLFGPALVMGGLFLQTRIFPTWPGFILSLPFGLLTCAILLANEVPDFADDQKSGKFTWVGLIGPERTYLLYFGLILLAFISIIWSIFLGLLGPLAWLALIFILPALKATRILKSEYAHKLKLMESSRLTIALHTMVSVVLILSLII
ncbi:prenyltransferase [Candidatus Omnitrophota bacterium]